jgi:hypothetical protein
LHGEEIDWLSSVALPECGRVEPVGVDHSKGEREMAKKKHGKRAKVSAGDALGDLTMERLPKGVEPRAAFILMKTTKGWYTRSVGGKAFKDLEFTSQLGSFTRSRLVSETKRWL